MAITTFGMRRLTISVLAQMETSAITHIGIGCGGSAVVHMVCLTGFVEWSAERCGDFGLDLLVHIRDRSAKQADGCDDGKHDERPDQPILDGGNALLVLQEPGQDRARCCHGGLRSPYSIATRSARRDSFQFVGRRMNARGPFIRPGPSKARLRCR